MWFRLLLTSIEDNMTRFLFFIAFLIPYFSFAAFSETPQPDISLSSRETLSFQTGDAFLRRMGFEDYVARAKATLATNQNIYPVSKWALELNSKNFESVNGARKMGSFVYALLHSIQNTSAPELDKKMAVVSKILIQQLKHFPQFRFEPLSVGDIAGKTVDEVLLLKNKALKKRMDLRFSTEKANLVRIYVNLWPNLAKRESGIGQCSVNAVLLSVNSSSFFGGG